MCSHLWTLGQKSIIQIFYTTWIDKNINQVESCFYARAKFGVSFGTTLLSMTSLMCWLIPLKPCLSYPMWYKVVKCNMFRTCEDSAIERHYRLRKKYTHMETYTSRIATLPLKQNGTNYIFLFVVLLKVGKSTKLAWCPWCEDTHTHMHLCIYQVQSKQTWTNSMVSDITGPVGSII